jgi:NAD(P)H-hydrate repair Nnr-like enzyme with NAD(P)H-hydrate dehydratase domain
MTTAPMNPLAGASGPGKYAVRSDKLSMGSTGYGEGVETQAVKSGAPLATTPDVKGQAPSKFRENLTQVSVTPLNAPSQRPNEPITAGIDMGPGPGSNALMMQKAVQKTSDTLAKMLPFDTDGSIAILYQQAVARGD